MDSLASLITKVTDLDPALIAVLLLAVVSLVYFHSYASKVLRTVERLARRRGEGE